MCTDSPPEAVFIGMCPSLPCRKKKSKVTQVRLELATLRLQVVRATITPPPLHSFVVNIHLFVTGNNRLAVAEKVNIPSHMQTTARSRGSAFLFVKTDVEGCRSHPSQLKLQGEILLLCVFGVNLLFMVPWGRKQYRSGYKTLLL